MSVRRFIGFVTIIGFLTAHSFAAAAQPGGVQDDPAGSQAQIIDWPEAPPLRANLPEEADEEEADADQELIDWPEAPPVSGVHRPDPGSQLPPEEDPAGIIDWPEAPPAR